MNLAVLGKTLNKAGVCLRKDRQFDRRCATVMLW